jgi:hypothetical protein
MKNPNVVIDVLREFNFADPNEHPAAAVERFIYYISGRPDEGSLLDIVVDALCEGGFVTCESVPRFEWSHEVKLALWEVLALVKPY